MKSFFHFATFVTLASCQPFGVYDLGLAEPGKTQPAVQCPQGFNLIGKKCEQIQTSPPQVICATGALINDMCTNYAAPVKQCPLGTTPIGKDGCAAYTLRPALAQCPDGFSDAGRAGCVAAKALPRVQVCEIGAMDASGQCILIETAPKIQKHYCPAGYQDLGKGCEQVTRFPCNPPPAPSKGAHVPAAAAPFPSYPYKHKKRMLGAKKYAVYAPRPVAAIPVPPPSKAAIPPPPPPPPAPKVAVVQMECERRSFAPPLSESYCPAGFSEVGKKCTKKSAYPPVQKCSTGAPLDDCVEKLSAPRLYTCQEGTLTGEQCQIQTMIPIEVTCPAGTHRVTDTQCASYTQPILTCPPGSIMEANVCVSRNYAEPTGQILRPCVGKECWNGQAHKKF